jgi:hypothetical protein
MARRAKPVKTLPIVWQCTEKRQWLCPLAGLFYKDVKHKKSPGAIFTRSIHGARLRQLKLYKTAILLFC